MNYNTADTDNGKLRCQERKTKKALNKDNIRENLSKYLTEEEKLNEAITDMWNNREIKVSYKLQKVKDKKTPKK